MSNYICTEWDCDGGLINLGQSFIECECKKKKREAKNKKMRCEYCHGKGELYQRDERVDCSKCGGMGELCGMNPYVDTGGYFIDGASRHLVDGASRSVTPWASQQIEVKQEGKKMTVQDIRDAFNAQLKAAGVFEKAEISKREEYLEEENKRLKARLRRQRKELKRLNKQIRGPKKTDKPSRFQAAIDLFRMGSIDTFSGAVPKTIDNLGQACDKYGCAGTYQETNLIDDVNGILHCKWCNKEVSRWT